MDKSKQRKAGAILSYVVIIVNTLVQLIYTPFLIRQLGQSEYGLYSLVASIIGYLTVLDLGFGNAIIVYTAKYRANKQYKEEQKLHGMFKIVFYIIAIVVTFLGILLYLNVENLFGKTMNETEIAKAKIMMLILTFNLTMTFCFNIYSSIIIAYEKFIFQKIMAIISALLKPMLMIPLLFLGYKSITMCIVITIVNIFILLSNYFYCKRKLDIKTKFIGFDKKLFKELFNYSFFIFLGVIVDKVNWSVDQFILGIVSGTIAVSIYAIAGQLNTLFINLSTAVSGVLLPKMSKMVAMKASGKELTDEMIKIGRIQYFIIFLMVSGFILVGKEFIIWWAGADYATSYYVTLILIVPLCFPIIQNLALSICQAMNKHKFRAVATSIMAIFNIIISYILGKVYGAIGCALGTSISLVVCNILAMNIYYKKVIKLEIGRFWIEILKMTIMFMIPFTITLFVINVTELGGISGVSIYATIYSTLYFFISYMCVMNKYEKNIINKVWNKLIKR